MQHGANTSASLAQALPRKLETRKNRTREKTASITKRTRKTKNGLTPKPIAMPKRPIPTIQTEKGKGDRKGQKERGQGKGTFPAKKDADCEHAGAGIVIH